MFMTFTLERSSVALQWILVKDMLRRLALKILDQMIYLSTLLKDIENTAVKQSQVLPPPPWIELPEDIMAIILHKLGPNEILVTAHEVCTTWRKICSRDPSMWRVIDMQNFTDDLNIYTGRLVPLVCLAVDLSQGELMEIDINDDDLRVDDVLGYIADRCGNLRRLRIEYNYKSNVELRKTVIGFPLLEELQLHLDCAPVSKDDIEAIGQSCPMLKKFVLHAHESANKATFESNEEAIAVARFMPELRHLHLGNAMTNEGLEAILNGCPKLESLDLRSCYHLDLETELWKSCIQRIKNLRRPRGPYDDEKYDEYGWDVKYPHEYYHSYSYSYDDFQDPFPFNGDSSSGDDEYFP